MIRISIRTLLTLALLAVASIPVSAIVVLPADFATIVGGADIIVHGRVIDVRSVLVGPQRTIESVVTMTVLESFKGVSAARVAFSVPNGQVGRYRRVLVGAPEFSEGDEAFVFLHARPPSLPTLFGLTQGVFRVTRDAAARAVVMPSPSGTSGDPAGRVVRGDPGRRPIPVAAFARDVQARLEPTR